jgi:hypothetical protein
MFAVALEILTSIADLTLKKSQYHIQVKMIYHCTYKRSVVNCKINDLKLLHNADNSLSFESVLRTILVSRYEARKKKTLSIVSIISISSRYIKQTKL